MTKRPVMVLVGTALQTSIAAICVGATALFVFLVFATPSEGLKMALLMVLPLATGAALSSWGMWKQRAWGWWTALVFNLMIFLMMIVDLVNGDPGLSDFAIAALFFTCFVLLLPSPVRRHFLSRDPV